jgi:hypothetical protein
MNDLIRFIFLSMVDMRKKLLLLSAFLFFTIPLLFAQNIITEKKIAGSFPIVSSLGLPVIYTDDQDFVLAQKAGEFLRSDVERVTGKKLSLVHSLSSSANHIIIIGTLEKSSLIRQLVAEKKINLNQIRGKWEAWHMQVIRKPFKGIDDALVIAGSDRRATAFAVFELSRQMGVSPWYWWADVPVKKKTELYANGNISATDSPLVKYRGIFINDEAPALSGWSKEKFGGFNHLFYEKVFELILRLKGNYLWPAMWGNAFYDDDSLNKKTADDYGIVIGTSHHEPLMRAHDEWRRYGHGPWNYDSNAATLRKFWEEGMKRIGNTETTVTIGMRGDGDKPMTEGTAISLLETIVQDQRRIIENVTGRPAPEKPQVWALYKEVQDYYDKGMRVPDDVTLLLCDDNWGNIRKLPRLSDKSRSGGYGIYYHFDYVGDPRNYKWLNTNSIPRVWEQMHLAWEYQVKQIWVVNVGDIKPMEFPISFFLDYAWNPKKIGSDGLQRYTQRWAAAQFGEAHAEDIADIISKYSKYNARRKPELLDADTYSIHHYNEADRVTNAYDDLLVKAEKIGNELPAEYKDAYFQLVLHPVKACSNLLQLYTTVAWNRWFASQHWAIANRLADKAKQLYLNDSLISLEYNKGIAGGKWNHMMDQTHIGYTYWQQPPFNRIPDVQYVPADSVREQATLISTKNITAEGLVPPGFKGNGFYEQDGYVSIAADHYTRAINSGNTRWTIIPDLGKTGSSVTIFPVTAPNQTPGGSSSVLQYEFYSYDSGKLQLDAYFSPSLNFHNDEGLQYGVSIDDEKPQIISINKDDNNRKIWEDWVANNIIIKTSEHLASKPGKHVLKYWMVTPAVVLQKLVIDFGGVKKSYLGPPETKIEKQSHQ